MTDRKDNSRQSTARRADSEAPAATASRKAKAPPRKRVAAKKPSRSDAGKSTAAANVGITSATTKGRKSPASKAPARRSLRDDSAAGNREEAGAASAAKPGARAGSRTGAKAVPNPAGATTAVDNAVKTARAGLSDLTNHAWTFDPTAVQKLQSDYLERMKALIDAGPQAAAPRDRRFQSEAWHEGLFGWNAALYELNAEFMSRLADTFEGDAKSRDRLRFATQQWIDATAPTNFLVSNPEAQKKLLETGGRSLATGLGNMLGDIQKGRISQTDESAFEVGRDLAVTPGQVVYQNELFQLVQYDPVTARVGELPLLMVPPCINKFYILDLQPANSVVAHMVAEGHTVFMLSWKNVRADQGDLTWDDYLSKGVVEAIGVTREICGTEQINALGFCVGGTIIATTLACLAARDERPVRSLTLLTTLLDFSNAGILNIFVDEAHVALREATIGNGGIMAGSELAQTFSALRPTDLIWNYVVRNYLQGEAPPAFDLLFWNSDSTNLPGPMFCWYLRHMYLQNELCQPGRLTCMGESVDLGAIDVPVYIYASREDHIVPWDSAYASTRLLDNDRRFVLGASGHIAGVINPPAKGKRNYWTNDRLVPDAQQWFDGATEHPGSWWPDWCEWLSRFRGPMVAARRPGTARYPVLEPAPGSYVKARASD